MLPKFCYLPIAKNYRYLRKYSAEEEPLVPALKLSTYLTKKNCSGSDNNLNLTGIFKKIEPQKVTKWIRRLIN